MRYCLRAGKIVPTAHGRLLQKQRDLARAIKRSRFLLGLLPYLIR